MNKKESQSLTDELLIADALLRLKCIENLLIAKGVFTLAEFEGEMESVTRKIAKTLLERANVSGNLDELIDSLGQKKDN